METMETWVDLEPKIRWILYLAGFSSIILWESFRPRKKLVASTPKRWGSRLVLVVAASSLATWMIPAGSIESAYAAREMGWGLLPRTALPLSIQAVIGLLVLDLSRYLQHYLFHSVGFLWRIHRVHHVDPDFDATTGLLFHPFEAAIAIVTYIPVVWLLGAPPAAVAIYELTHVFHAFFAHGNVTVAGRLETVLRRWIVTPDMHRVHHSEIVSESRANYGQMFPFWDRLFGTYQAQPLLGHERMGIGMAGYQDARSLNVIRLLLWPFSDRAMGPPIEPSSPAAAASESPTVKTRAA